MAKSRGMPFTAIPVVPRRLFSLSQMWVNIDAGILSSKDLIGRKVGFPTRRERSLDQGLMAKKLKVKELFHESTWGS